MSRTLNLVDGLLLMGRRHQQLGRVRDALTILARLASFRELPREVAEETQVRLAEIQLHRRKYRRARRHLAVALRYDPDNARYHHLMATALRGLGEDQWDRAAVHYRRSLELDAEQDDCLTEFGLFAVRLGYADEGLNWLRHAVEQKPGDPDVLGKLIEGLRLAGRGDECCAELRAALFRNPQDRRFRQLWADDQFRQLHQAQHEQLRSRAGADEGPILLPFVPRERPVPADGQGQVIRQDGPSTFPPPHGARPAQVPDKRHVQ
ncbi:MAG: tetratricopeptide repeat protein [Planctomycetes bacterium]|nr:tetratricopeptide repeat protein [Planctomycetota bacterium]